MDVFYFGEILYELLDSITDSQPLKDCLLGLSSSQKDKIPESLVELVVACLSRDPENRPEFTLIAQNLESISSTINRAGDLDVGYGDLMSEIPFPTVYEEMHKSRHDADNQVEQQNTVDARIYLYIQELDIHTTPESTFPMSTELMDNGTLEEYMLELKPDVPINKTATKLALRISEAMQHLHAQGTHGDLKSNKDFFSLGGLEHREEKTDDMDLEHFKADVYNFSQILWELLTNNHTPFQASASSTKEKRPILEGVPYEMLELSMCCGSEKAEERPDFSQIIDTLTKLLNQQTPQEKV
ncbi:hypothetical protein LIER_38924 [Lithospermum erythrorhizon]|uniref:Protein kinase domain-containing protein n=1 Tax=Lithospermum erythrorhizon TaxID=34254 RepID=A0AAV3Q6W5_LITER